MMISFYAAFLFLWKIALTISLKLSSSLHQESLSSPVKAGDTLNLRCFYEVDGSAWFYWYKQALGQKPILISTFFVYHTKGTFFDEFKNNPRFMLSPGNGTNHLRILDLHISDSATYYCAKSQSFKFEFAEGTTVSVQGSGYKVSALVHQSDSETIQPGFSVTLNCSVQTRSRDGEHSVYWFKDSEESHPGIIYTHGERKPETQPNSCVYNLPVSVSNTENYCAVASCGQILFRNRTKSDLKDNGASFDILSGSSFHILGGALAFNSFLVVLLAILVYKMNKRNVYKSPESHPGHPGTSITNTESQDADSLQYSTLSVKLPHIPRGQKKNNSRTECVYSSVKL